MREVWEEDEALEEPPTTWWMHLLPPAEWDTEDLAPAGARVGTSTSCANSPNPDNTHDWMGVMGGSLTAYYCVNCGWKAKLDTLTGEVVPSKFG